jgi:hypothetical protein
MEEADLLKLDEPIILPGRGLHPRLEEADFFDCKRLTSITGRSLHP